MPDGRFLPNEPEFQSYKGAGRYRQTMLSFGPEGGRLAEIRDILLERAPRWSFDLSGDES